MKALCDGLPPDWWDTYDDGARLALALCSVCPFRPACDRGQQWGVIRAGVAWNELGRPAGLCGCGYPLPVVKEVERAQCYRCEPPWDTRIPRAMRKKRRRYSADVLLGEVAAMRRDGATLRDISAQLRVPYSTLRDVIRRARPQAVSTGEDAA